MKEFLIFIGLFIFDFILEILLMHDNSIDFGVIYLPIIFIEIALFGCVILYKLNHKDKNKDKDDFND